MTQRERPGERRPTYREVMEHDGAPAGLFVTQEARAASWAASPPRPFQAPPPEERSVDPATAALAIELEERRKAKTRARIEKLKRPKVDVRGKRWDPRISQWINEGEEVDVISIITNTRGATKMKDWTAVEDFTAMDGPGLARAYGEMATSKLGVELGAKPVTKFTDKETGVKRCQALASSIKARYEGLAGIDPDEQSASAGDVKHEEDEVASAKKSKKRTVKSKKRTTNAKTVKTNGNGGSGAYIRELIMGGKHDTARIVEMVHKKFPESRAKAGDVSWNRGKLKRDGHRVPEVS